MNAETLERDAFTIVVGVHQKNDLFPQAVGRKTRKSDFSEKMNIGQKQRNKNNSKKVCAL